MRAILPDRFVVSSVPLRRRPHTCGHRLTARRRRLGTVVGMPVFAASEAAHAVVLDALDAEFRGPHAPRVYRELLSAIADTLDRIVTGDPDAPVEPELLTIVADVFARISRETLAATGTSGCGTTRVGTRASFVRAKAPQDREAAAVRDQLLLAALDDPATSTRDLAAAVRRACGGLLGRDVLAVAAHGSCTDEVLAEAAVAVTRWGTGALPTCLRAADGTPLSPLAALRGLGEFTQTCLTLAAEFPGTPAALAAAARAIVTAPLSGPTVAPSSGGVT